MERQPIRPAIRLLHLDVLRGFALFGILLVNFEWFTRSTQAMLLGSATDMGGLDGLAARSIVWLAESKFFPLFSMLFGMGFALMMDRAQAAGRPFVGTYVRRLLALAVFGLCHIAFVWSGDILFMYALIAFLMLLFFRKTPTRRLYKWAIACWLFPLIVTAGFAAMSSLLPEDHEVRLETVEAMQAGYEALLVRIEYGERIHQHGSFPENVGQRIRDFAVLSRELSFFWIPMVLGYFLFGRWLLESGIMMNPEQHAARLRRWQVWGLAIGLPTALVADPLLREAHHMLPDGRLVLGLMLYLGASIALSLAYLAIVTRHAERLRFLAPAGRMALTHYLLQSLFWITIFYGYGFGAWGRIPRAMQVLLTLIFFAAQVGLSHVWMKRHRYGPMEWVWRAMTHLRWPV